MKLIDKILRQWRVGVALQALPRLPKAIFDIGCDDGYLLKKFDGLNIQLDGCDPRLIIKIDFLNSIILKGYFPYILNSAILPRKYDAIFALAVFEHFSALDLEISSRKIAEILADDGKLIVTIPHPFVDRILDFLTTVKLIDGQALEEHHGFDPESLINIFSSHLILKYRKRFQLGLNNLFVFE